MDLILLVCLVDAGKKSAAKIHVSYVDLIYMCTYVLLYNVYMYTVYIYTHYVDDMWIYIYT